MLFENRTKEQSLTLFCSVCSEFLARYKCCSDSCSCSFPLPSQQLHNLSQLPCILTQYPLNTSYRRRHNMFSIWVVKKSEGNGKKNLGKKKKIQSFYITMKMLIVGLLMTMHPNHPAEMIRFMAESLSESDFFLN